MLSALNMAISNFYGCFHEYLEGNPMHDASPLAPTFLGTKWRPNASTCIRRYSLEDSGMAPKGSNFVPLCPDYLTWFNSWETSKFRPTDFNILLILQSQHSPVMCTNRNNVLRVLRMMRQFTQVLAGCSSVKYDTWYIHQRFNRDPQIWYNMVLPSWSPHDFPMENHDLIDRSSLEIPMSANKGNNNDDDNDRNDNTIFGS